MYMYVTFFQVATVPEEIIPDEKLDANEEEDDSSELSDSDESQYSGIGESESTGDSDDDIIEEEDEELEFEDSEDDEEEGEEDEESDVELQDIDIDGLDNTKKDEKSAVKVYIDLIWWVIIRHHGSFSVNSFSSFFRVRKPSSQQVIRMRRQDLPMKSLMPRTMKSLCVKAN